MLWHTWRDCWMSQCMKMHCNIKPSILTHAPQAAYFFFLQIFNLRLAQRSSLCLLISHSHNRTHIASLLRIPIYGVMSLDLKLDCISVLFHFIFLFFSCIVPYMTSKTSVKHKRWVAIFFERFSNGNYFIEFHQIFGTYHLTLIRFIL